MDRFADRVTRANYAIRVTGGTLRGIRAGSAYHAPGRTSGRLLLDKVDAREQALAREAGQARAVIDDLAARVREPGEAIAHLQITRKTLLSLAGETAPSRSSRLQRCPATPAASKSWPSSPRPAGPWGARDLCQALHLRIVPKNTENIRSKLKRLASRGILIETEPGLFTQPRP